MNIIKNSAANGLMMNEINMTLFYEINKELVKPCPKCGDPMLLDDKSDNCLLCEINKIEHSRLKFGFKEDD